MTGETCTTCNTSPALANSSKCRTCWDAWWRQVVRRAADARALKRDQEPPCP